MTSEHEPRTIAFLERGGRIKVVNSRFFNNVCASTGPDTAGGAIYALSQYQGQPIYVGHSTFGGGPTLSNTCSNGGAIGSIYNPTDAQILGAINYLNAVYNGTYPGTQGVGDLGIQFVMAQRDPNCNPTNGINRVELLINGKVVTKDTKAGYSFSINTKKYAKTMKVQLRAYDKAGNSFTTTTRTWHR